MIDGYNVLCFLMGVRKLPGIVCVRRLVLVFVRGRVQGFSICYGPLFSKSFIHVVAYFFGLAI